MAAEKMRLFTDKMLSISVLLVRKGSLRRAELRDYGDRSLKFAKTAD
jgi:hypothetical protein